MTDRCTGACCRAFPLPYGPIVLSSKRHTIIQGGMIADMVIYLGEHSSSPVTGKPNPPMNDHAQGRPDPDDPTGPRLVHFYTCKNLNTKTGDCKAYDTRPDMCVDYPYGNKCDHEDCTWSVGREGGKIIGNVEKAIEASVLSRKESQ